MAAKTSESSAYRLELEEVPSYHPTMEEFTNPMTYIASIREEAEHFGLARIVPPEGWKPPWLIDGKKFTFATRVQVKTAPPPVHLAPWAKVVSVPDPPTGEQAVVMAGITARWVHIGLNGGVEGLVMRGERWEPGQRHRRLILSRAALSCWVKGVGGRPTEPLIAHLVSNSRQWLLQGGSAGYKRGGCRQLGSHSSRRGCRLWQLRALGGITLE